MKKERATTSDEQRERMLIAEQIERAAAEGSGSGSSVSPPPEQQELKREGEKVVLSLAPKTTNTAAPVATGLKLNPLKVNPLKPAVNPLKAKANPLKRHNPPAPPPAASGDGETVTGKKRDLSAAERLMFEDQERKRRKMERDAKEVMA